LYLFDTFEGFTKHDISAEVELGNQLFISGIFNEVGLYSNTSVELVMERMPFPEKVKIIKGSVLDTLKDIDDIFCFVNLDMDLYKPMLEALKFFFERTVSGGVVLCHNYSYPESLPGVRQAVEDFEKHVGQKLPKIPLADRCSIAIIKF
jgi:hypothetical protein